MYEAYFGKYSEGARFDMSKLSGHSTSAKFAIWLTSFVSVIPIFSRYFFGKRWCRSRADLVDLTAG
jgi:hypothetical protein